MQPYDQQPPTQYSNDYLDTIAPQRPTKTMNPLALWGLIGGLLILAIIVIVAVSSSAGGGSTSSLAGVGAKLLKLKETTDKAQKNIQSGDLRSLNSSMTLVLTNANRDLTKPLGAQKINLEEPKKNETVAQVFADYDKVASRLDDARLNAVFDRTYAREMTFAIKTLRSDMEIVYASTRNDELKTALETIDGNLTPLLEGYEDFNGS